MENIVLSVLLLTLAAQLSVALVRIVRYYYRYYGKAIHRTYYDDDDEYDC